MSENHADYISKLLIAMKENSIAKLKMEYKGIKVNLVRSEPTTVIVSGEIPNEIIPLEITSPAISTDSSSYLTQNSNDEVVIKSPVVGIYHQLDKIDVGSHVKPGQKLAFIDILGIKKEITSSVSGIISQIHIEENNGVEYGEPLFSIIPA